MPLCKYVVIDSKNKKQLKSCNLHYLKLENTELFKGKWMEISTQSHFISANTFSVELAVHYNCSIHSQGKAVQISVCT